MDEFDSVASVAAPTPFRMPAEWEPQSAIWLAWPDNRETWPDNRVAAQLEFTALVKSLAEMVTVYVMVNQDSVGVAKRNLLHHDEFNTHLINIPTNDAWARDFAPTFVLKNGNQLAAVNWRYNAWGGKYPPFDLDQAAGQKIVNVYRDDNQDVDLIEPGLCFEGGAIETNGQGIVLSTSSCADQESRNPQVAADQRRKHFENAFRQYLGASDTIWIPGGGVAGDDTDGHIDQLIRFTDDSTLVYAWCEPEDPRHELLAGNLAALQQGLSQISKQPGRQFKLIPLMLPPAFEKHGRGIPASYCNFVITNDLVVVPQFGYPSDALALETLGALFPDRHILGLPSSNLTVGLGSFHCLTQQVPRLEEAESSSR